MQDLWCNESIQYGVVLQLVTEHLWEPPEGPTGHKLTDNRRHKESTALSAENSDTRHTSHYLYIRHIRGKTHSHYHSVSAIYPLLVPQVLFSLLSNRAPLNATL